MKVAAFERPRSAGAVSVRAMRLLAVAHQDDAGPGVFADALEAEGHALDVWMSPQEQSPPGAPAGYDAVIVLGGAVNVEDAGELPYLREELRIIRELLDAGVPTLGVCLGSQLLAEAAGGSVERASEPEIGWFDVEVTAAGRDDPLLGPLAPGFVAFEWHSYACVLPKGATELARSRVCTQAFRVGDAAWGIQFHAEVSPADTRRWIERYRADPDAVRVEIDPDALRAETEPRLPAWNELGRKLVLRFTDVAATRA